jgi:hypothetical protein
MKHLPLIICIFSFCQSAFGQSDSSRHKFTELGLNATAFVNQYLDFGDDINELTSPYILTYERRLGKYGFRAGIGIDGKRDIEEPENGLSTAPTLNITEVNLNLRSGWVNYISLSRRWDLKWGTDLTFGYNNNKNWTEVTNLFGDRVTSTNSDLTWDVGVNPFIFAQFHLSERFSLATELLLDISYRQSVTKTQSTEFPEFDVRQESSGIRYIINPPIALFFIFRI